MKNARIECHEDVMVRWGWVLQTAVKAGLAIYFLLGVVAILAL